MSRITRQKIYYPTTVRTEIYKISNKASLIWLSGQYGTSFFKSNLKHSNIEIFSSSQLHVKIMRLHNLIKHFSNFYFKNWFPSINSDLGLQGALLKRIIIGAGIGFKNYLRVRGVGYKFDLEANNLLTAKVGCTHLIKKQVPFEFIINFSRKARVVRFQSKSLVKLTNLLSKVRALRQPDVYKGKGIRFIYDSVLQKPGKRKTKAVSKKKAIKKHAKIIQKQLISRKKSKTRLVLFNKLKNNG